MKTQSVDTCPEAEKVLISLVRKESPSKKLYQIISFSQTAMQLSKRAISRANRHLDDAQIKLLFIKYHYGNNIADRVKEYIQKGRNDTI